jgi:hypothetical protein
VDDLVGQGVDIAQIVGHEQGGDSGFVNQSAKELAELDAGGRVEGREGFVEQEEAG